MRRALRRAIGILTAAGVVALARPASAQAPSSPPQGQPAPARMALYPEGAGQAEGRIRLEEMKVELALLSDATTFPYYLGTRAAGGGVEVRGYVPNETVKQRALELARRNCSLRVTDGLRVQAGLSLRPSRRGAEDLQREGEALLAKDFGETGRRLRVEAGPDGQVTVTGTIGSVEEKLAVSRLFRHLPGCSAVVNRLNVQPILRDGQRVVAVTKNGSQAVPTTLLGAGPEPIAASPTPPRPMPAVTQSAAAPPSSLAVQDQELHLPLAASGKPARARPAITSGTLSACEASPETTPSSRARPAITSGTLSPVEETPLQRVAASKPADEAPPPASAPPKSRPPSASVDILTAPKPPASWSRPTIRRESEAKEKPAAPPAAPPAPAMRTVVAPPKPITAAPPRTVSQPAAVAPPQTAPVRQAPAAPPPQKQIAIVAPPKPAAPAAPIRSAVAPAAPRPSPAPAAADVSMGSLPPLRSARRWPPAYDVRPPEAEEARPGSIRFDEGPAAPDVAIGPPRPIAPPPVRKPMVQKPAAPLTVASPPRPAAPPPDRKPIAQQPAPPRIVAEPPRPIAPPDRRQLDLRQKVLAICGQQARDVQVERHGDGSVKVKVKAPSFAAEQLTRQILTIPEMSSPNVSLMIELVP